MNRKEKEIIEDLSLIKNIIKYIVGNDSDFLRKKENEKQGRLEEKIFNDRKLKTKPDQPDNLQFLEQALFELKNNIKNDKKGNFSLNIKKEKDKEEIKQDYSFIIKYQENENEEKLMIEAEDKNKERYFFEIRKEKPISDEKPYQLNIIYENNKTEEKLKIKYNLRDYPSEREKALQDFTNKVDKTLHIFPKSIMGGVLGFTYLGENFMGRRDDLVGSKALMVDVHEAIHTNDEYETRVLTDWMLTRERMRYKR